MEMTLFETIILALVQGMTEFLPISSSGHLALLEHFFEIKEGLSVSVALHFGTALAVVVYFYRDWLEIFRKAFSPKAVSKQYTQKTLYFLVIATLPAAAFGFFLEDVIECLIQRPAVIVGLIVVASFCLWMADISGHHRKTVKEVTWKEALLVGFSQILALIPGVSRSGVTIMTALVLGMKRREAAHFSFLLATPIIVGASILKIPDLVTVGLTGQIFLGISISFVVAYLTIKWMMRFIERVAYRVFFVYSLVLALVFIFLYR